MTRTYGILAYACSSMMLAVGGANAACEKSKSLSDYLVASLSRADLHDDCYRGLGVRHASMAVADPASTRRAVAQLGSADLSVQFATGSADLTPSAMRLLDQLGIALSNSKLAGDRFRIEGHTDTVGTADENKALSQQRAERVVSYLRDKFNVDSSRLVAEGVGEDDLLVKTGDQVPELRNRRVHIVNLGA